MSSFAPPGGGGQGDVGAPVDLAQYMMPSFIPFNVTQRATAGLGRLYASLRPSSSCSTASASSSSSSPSSSSTAASLQRGEGGHCGDASSVGTAQEHWQPQWHFTGADGRLHLPSSGSAAQLPTLHGRYRPLRLIGNGTFSQIIEAQDLYSPREGHVAIKVLRAEHALVGVQELVLLSRLNARDRHGHSKIVRVKSHFYFGPHFCMVMELLGASLLGFARAASDRTQAPVSLDEVRKVAIQLVTSLAFLDSLGMIHGDIKPENVLLDSREWSEPRMKPGCGFVPRPSSASASASPSAPPPHLPSPAATSPPAVSSRATMATDLVPVQAQFICGSCRSPWSPRRMRVRLVDFGNAFAASAASSYFDDFELQTLYYRAPEVALGLPFGTGIDMWSIGCVLAELFLGSPLFPGFSNQEIVSAMVEVLGPLPRRPYENAKFRSQYPDEFFVDATDARNSEEAASRRLNRLSSRLGTRSADFVTFLCSMLHFDPDRRLSPREAMFHPFLARLCPLGLVFPDSVSPPRSVNRFSCVANSFLKLQSPLEKDGYYSVWQQRKRDSSGPAGVDGRTRRAKRARLDDEWGRPDSLHDEEVDDSRDSSLSSSDSIDDECAPGSGDGSSGHNDYESDEVLCCPSTSASEHECRGHAGDDKSAQPSLREQVGKQQVRLQQVANCGGSGDDDDGGGAVDFEIDDNDNDDDDDGDDELCGRARYDPLAVITIKDTEEDEDADEEHGDDEDILLLL